MHYSAAIALGAALSGAAFAGGPGLAQFGFDIDGNGTEETEGTWLRMPLGFFGNGGEVTFSYAFMTSESSNPDPYNDMFRVRVTDVTRGISSVFGGAVDDSSYSADPGFESFDFDDADHEGPVRTPITEDGRLWFSNGLIGWRTATIMLPSFDPEGEGGPGGGDYILEFLVADSDDTAVASGLAIDNIFVSGSPDNVQGGPNLGFEDGLTGWDFEGQAMVVSQLEDALTGAAVLTPGEGNFFALIGTNMIPAPGAISLGGLALLAGLRRRR